MKFILVFLILLSNFSPTVAQTQHNKTPKYNTPENILELLKEKPEDSINGPFLLHIKSIENRGNNLHLNTSNSLSTANNITIQMSPFIQNYYINRFEGTIHQLFLNQNLIIKGKLKVMDYSLNQDTTEITKIPTIKLIFTDQITFYD